MSCDVAVVGAAWRTRYDSFRLHTVRWLSALPGLPIPTSYGPWVARDDFVRYLEDYATRFQVAPELGTELSGLARTAGGWRLQTSRGEIDARRVVLATGACNSPHVPTWPGRSGSSPPVTYSSNYRNPGPYGGRRVLVVGSGNSATEVATDLAAARDVSVELAVRTPPSILRRDTAGIPSQALGIALRHVPAAVVDPLGAATRKLTIPDLRPGPARATGPVLPVTPDLHGAGPGLWLRRRRTPRGDRDPIGTGCPWWRPRRPRKLGLSDSRGLPTAGDQSGRPSDRPSVSRREAAERPR